MMDENKLYEQNYQLLLESISKVEDPCRNGLYFWGDTSGIAHLIRPDPHSGKLTQHELSLLSIDMQPQDGIQKHIDMNEFVAQKLCIFLFNADFGSKSQSSYKLLPQEAGDFQIFSLQQDITKPILLSASVASDCKLDLTAIGVANQQTKELFGLRAIFPGNYTKFGVVALTTSQDVMSLWYWEKFESGNLYTSSKDDEYTSIELLHERHWKE